MISQTIVDLCDAVSELAAERNEYRRKAESQAARHSDEVEALRAERDEARCSMFDAATDRDDANHAADKARWDAEQLRRELAAMQAERTELAALRAKLAFQTQIAEGATQQRDERTTRLKDALNQLESTTEVKVIVDAALCRATVDMESLRAERDGLRAEVERLTAERDALETKLAAAQRLWESMKADKAERDALKASNPTVDVEELSRVFHEGGRLVFSNSFAKNQWNSLDDTTRAAVRAGVRALIAHIGIEEAGKPSGEQTREVGT